MRKAIILFLLSIPFFVFGQENSNEDPKTFHEEGLAIVNKENPTGFEKVLALGKFRKSQQIISKSGTDNQSLQAKNDEQIDLLANFFKSIEDSDSLLNTTVFFPDSAFNANSSFPEKVKNLIPDLLETKRRKLRKDFSKIDGLNFRDPKNPKTSNFILTFERYWPLEVMEFEKYFLQLNNSYRNLSRGPKEELIFSQLKSEMDSLSFAIQNSSLNLNIKHIQQQKDGIEAELSTAQKTISRYKNIGFGMIALIILWSLFIRRKSSQLLKSANQKLLEEKKRSEELLLNILPAEVAKELKNQASVKAKKHDEVTVLFSDFKSFSQIAKSLEPEILVKELDYCFKEFDRIIDKHRLQKIKTIGDAYMCVGGLYTKGSKHVGRIVLAALEIQRFLENYKKEKSARNEIFFEARMGIHIGPVVSGVVGSKKFAFDIWGDTVNVAQQMETNGKPGKVNVSEAIYSLIKNDFECTSRGKMIAKNKKEFEMYFVEKHLNPPNFRKDAYIRK